MPISSDHVNVSAALVAGLLVVFLPANVFAADLSDVPGLSAEETFQPQASTRRNFYVRGDVGIGRTSAGEFSQQELSDNGGSFISAAIDDSMLIGAGFGWQINRNFRLDLTGEYRSTAQIKAMDNLRADLVDPDGVLQANTLYQGNLTSYVGLLNAYYDVFTWRGFTPYVGAGIGIAHNSMSDFTTASSSSFIDAATGAETIQLTNGTAQSNSQSTLAWALMAGTSYDISPSAKLDLGYRYINLGSGLATATGPIDCLCGTTGSPLELSDLHASEVRIGILWQLGSPPQDPDYTPLK